MFANLVIAAAVVLLSGAAFGASDGPRAAAKSADFFVATNGSDKWSGRLAEPNEQGTDGPFATLGRARDAVRAARGSRLRKDVIRPCPDSSSCAGLTLSSSESQVEVGREQCHFLQSGMIPCV